MLNVSVHSDGAAVDHAPHSGSCGCLDDLLCSRGVDGAVRGGRDSGLTIDRGDVVDDVGPADCALDRSPVTNVSCDKLDPVGFETTCPHWVVHKGAYGSSPSHEESG
jgi:hypothetical protein